MSASEDHMLIHAVDKCIVSADKEIKVWFFFLQREAFSGLLELGNFNIEIDQIKWSGGHVNKEKKKTKNKLNQEMKLCNFNVILQQQRSSQR